MVVRRIALYGAFAAMPTSALYSKPMICLWANRFFTPNLLAFENWDSGPAATQNRGDLSRLYHSLWTIKNGLQHPLLVGQSRFVHLLERYA